MELRIAVPVLFIIFKLLSSMSTLTSAAPSCPAPPAKPLMLTPYIQSKQTAQAKKLSRVSSSCLKDFVPTSYSGFLTVNKLAGNHLFFWYFPSPKDSSAPLLVWLNGGPGISSMQGLLYQNGPLKIEKDGQGWSYSKRSHSFVGSFSVLYIDSPVGVGYSFSDKGADSLHSSYEENGEDLFEFMNQFVQLFPKYQSKNEVYIGGQSYAGKYIPDLGQRIHLQKTQGKSKINLKGFYLSGPLFDPETNFEYIHDYYYSMGVISHQMLMDYKKKARDDFKLFKAGALKGDTIQRVADTIMPFKLPSNVYNYVTGSSYDIAAMNDVMNSGDMKSALHVGKDLSYVADSEAVFNKMFPDLRRSAKDKLAVLMDNYKVMVYNGDYDIITNTNTVEAGLLATGWKGLSDYKKAYRKPWSHGGKIRGFYSSVGKFCRAIVHGAGHDIGIEQEESNLVLLEQFVRNGCVS